MRIPPQTGRIARHPHLPPGGAEMLRGKLGYCQEMARHVAQTRSISIQGSRVSTVAAACRTMGQSPVVSGLPVLDSERVAESARD